MTRPCFLRGISGLGPLVLAIVAFGLTSCDSPKSTIESLRTEIAAYKADPTPEREAKIEAHFQKLDGQIGKLESKGKDAEADAYRESENNLRADYRAAKMTRALQNAQSAVNEVGEAFKEAGRSIGNAFRDLAGPSPDDNKE